MRVAAAVVDAVAAVMAAAAVVVVIVASSIGCSIATVATVATAVVVDAAAVVSAAAHRLAGVALALRLKAALRPRLPLRLPALRLASRRLLRLPLLKLRALRSDSVRFPIVAKRRQPSCCDRTDGDLPAGKALRCNANAAISSSMGSGVFYSRDDDRPNRNVIDARQLDDTLINDFAPARASCLSPARCSIAAQGQIVAWLARTRKIARRDSIRKTVVFASVVRVETARTDDSSSRAVSGLNC